MSYHDQQSAQNTLKLRELLKSLPPFMAGYFRSLSDQTAARTRLAYAYDFRIFFAFLSEKVFDGAEAEAITVEDMARKDNGKRQWYGSCVLHFFKTHEPYHCLFCCVFSCVSFDTNS